MGDAEDGGDGVDSEEHVGATTATWKPTHQSHEMPAIISGWYKISDQ
jgi:hypothetical protein